MEQKPPIYCFKLDTVKHSLTKTVITDYEWRNNQQHKAARYKAKNGSHKYCYWSELNQFWHGQVYMLEDNAELARQIAVDALESRLNKLHNDIARTNNLLQMLIKN